MTVRQRMIVKKVMVYHGGDLMADAHIEVNQVNEIPVVFQFFFFWHTVGSITCVYDTQSTVNNDFGKLLYLSSV